MTSTDRLLGEEFSHAAINAHRLLVHKSVYQIIRIAQSALLLLSTFLAKNIAKPSSHIAINA